MDSQRCHEFLFIFTWAELWLLTSCSPQSCLEMETWLCTYDIKLSASSTSVFIWPALCLSHAAVLAAQRWDFYPYQEELRVQILRRSNKPDVSPKPHDFHFTPDAFLFLDPDTLQSHMTRIYCLVTVAHSHFHIFPSCSHHLLHISDFRLFTSFFPPAVLSQ